MNESNPPPPHGLLSRLKNLSLAVLRMLHGGKDAAERADQPDLPENDSRRRGFEIVDANSMQIALLCFGLVILVALSMVAVTLIYDQRLKMQTNAFGEGYQGGATQRTPIEETWKALEAENAAHLTGYRWVDKQQEVVQIPIERAMSLTQETEVHP